ncbi:MAG: MarR family transcriptional regulator [Longimicrobiales bacterium]
MSTTSEELADRVHSLAMHLLRRVRAADADSALSAARLSALSMLVFSGPRSVGELAAAEQVTAPTMSRLVTGLEREGYVSREPDSADGRRVRVVVTPAGVRALNEARQHRIERTASLLEGIGPARREVIQDAAEILEAALEGEREASRSNAAAGG